MEEEKAYLLSKHTSWLHMKPNCVQYMHPTALNQCGVGAIYKYCLHFYPISSASLADAALFLNELELAKGETVILFMFQFIKYAVHNPFSISNERISV